jgi:predicted DNA binding CopG/RHH family protein
MKQKDDRLRKVPRFKSVEEAAAFLEQDLSDLDYSQFKPMHLSFELKPKEKTVNMRMSEDLYDALRERAKREGVPYQRFIRYALEKAVSEPKGEKVGAS